MKKTILGLAVAAALALSGCDTSTFNAGLIQTTQNLVALNNALVQVNNTIIGNVIAQAKLLAPYECGAVALASAIINDSTAQAAVNSFIKSKVAANVSVVAVQSICSALGYSTTVNAAPVSAVPAIVTSGN